MQKKAEYQKNLQNLWYINNTSNTSQVKCIYIALSSQWASQRQQWQEKTPSEQEEETSKGTKTHKGELIHFRLSPDSNNHKKDQNLQL